MEYKEAKRIRERSLSTLIADSPGGFFSSVGRAVSLKMKAKATGIQEKFDPMNIAKVVTGGSRLAPALLGRLTGRKQSSIEYFAGNKRQQQYGMATRIPTMQAPQGAAPASDESAPILAQMLAFMKKSREEDLKLRNTQKSFAEERENEAQKRHEKFIKVLQKFTDTQTASTVKKESGGSIMDFLTDMFNSMKNSFGSMIEKVYDSFQWVTKLGPVLMNIARFFTMNPIGIGLLAGATLLSLLYNDKNPEKTTDAVLGAGNEGAISTEITKQQEENVSPEEIQKKQKARKALLKDAPFLTRVYQVNADEYLEKLGLSEGERKNLTDYTVPFVMPKKLKEVDPEMAAELSNTKVPVKETPVEKVKADSKPAIPEPLPKPPEPKKVEASPIPPTPTSSILPNLVTRNNDLNTSAIAGIMPAPGPIVSSTNSAGSIPDTPITSSASQRDDTHILNKVMKAARSFAY